MSTTTAEPTVPVAPFRIEFDYEADHCSKGIRYALGLLEDSALRQRLEARVTPTMGDDQFHSILEDEANNLRQAINQHTRAAPGDHQIEPALPGQLAQVARAAESLTFCENECDCSRYAYEPHEHALDTALQSLEDHIWAVVEVAWDERTNSDDIEGTLSLEDIEGAAQLSSWSQIIMEWDGAKLRCERSGRHGSRTLEIVALNAAQRELHKRWSDSWWQPGVAAAIIVENHDAVAFALDVCAGGQSSSADFEGLVFAYTQLAPSQRSQLDTSVTTAALQDWKGTHCELLACVLAATEKVAA